MIAFRRAYGAGPLHLLLSLAGLGVAAFAFNQIFSGGHADQLLEWYLGFALAQDLVLVPLYTLADRGLTIRSNYLRVPAFLSGLLLLVYAPLITGVGAHTYRFYSGHPVSGYVRNWLLISAALFAGSAVVYGWRSRHARG